MYQYCCRAAKCGLKFIMFIYHVYSWSSEQIRMYNSSQTTLRHADLWCMRIFIMFMVKEPHGPLFARKWRFVYVQLPNGPKYHSNFTVLLMIF